MLAVAFTVPSSSALRIGANAAARTIVLPDGRHVGAAVRAAVPRGTVGGAGATIVTIIAAILNTAGARWVVVVVVIGPQLRGEDVDRVRAGVDAWSAHRQLAPHRAGARVVAVGVISAASHVPQLLDKTLNAVGRRGRVAAVRVIVKSRARRVHRRVLRAVGHFGGGEDCRGLHKTAEAKAHSLLLLLLLLGTSVWCVAAARVGSSAVPSVTALEADDCRCAGVRRSRGRGGCGARECGGRQLRHRH